MCVWSESGFVVGDKEPSRRLTSFRLSLLAKAHLTQSMLLSTTKISEVYTGVTGRCVHVLSVFVHVKDALS
jgi:hypothetical protein